MDINSFIHMIRKEHCLFVHTIQSSLFDFKKDSIQYKLFNQITFIFSNESINQNHDKNHRQYTFITKHCVYRYQSEIQQLIEALKSEFVFNEEEFRAIIENPKGQNSNFECKLLSIQYLEEEKNREERKKFNDEINDLINKRASVLIDKYDLLVNQIKNYNTLSVTLGRRKLFSQKSSLCVILFNFKIATDRMNERYELPLSETKTDAANAGNVKTPKSFKRSKDEIVNKLLSFCRLFNDAGFEYVSLEDLELLISGKCNKRLIISKNCQTRVETDNFNNGDDFFRGDDGSIHFFVKGKKQEYREELGSAVNRQEDHYYF